MSETRFLKALRGMLTAAEPMARHTTWRTGGHAAHAYRPADLADLQVFMQQWSPTEPVHFVGLGSNLLVRDGGLPGVVILTHPALGRLEMFGCDASHGRLRVQAGVASPKVARFAAMHGLAGAEFLAGVPGTVGGALAMNAGCYGGETWRQVERVTVLRRDGSLLGRAADEYVVGYRSVQPRQPDIIPEWFVAAELCYPRGDEALARARIKDLLTRRIASQPLNLPNAGSVFRNPPGDHAARLIEACGLKGYASGGASISQKHANFIVNPGGRGCAADIEHLIEFARTQVRERFGVELESEVRVVGQKEAR